MKLELLKELAQTTVLNGVSFDLPLFIRVLEWAREEVKEDVDLHILAETAAELMITKTFLTMADYDALLKNTGAKK